MDELEISLTKLSDPFNYRTTLVHHPSNNISKCDFTLELDRLAFTEKLYRLDQLALGLAKDTGQLAEELGRELFHTALQGEVNYKFRHYSENKVRIRLRIEPEELKNIPWEFIHNGEDFIGATTLFSRIPWGVELETHDQVEGPLRVLVVISNPLDLEEHLRLDIDAEMEALAYAFEPLEKENLLEVDCCDIASPEAVRDFLLGQDYHILHFVGHGCFDQKKNRGCLLMEDSQGKKRLVDNEEVSWMLQNTPSLRLVTLSACQTAQTSQTEGLRDVARGLLKKKIPAVVAMRLSVLDRSAIKFARSFYRTIAHKRGIDEAMTESRNALLLMDQSNRVDFATPLLFLNDPACLDLSDMKPRKPEEIKIEPISYGSVGVMEKGFVGRHREIRIIRDGFKSDRKRLAIIHGFGGIGKSVLATTIAQRMKKHFQLIKAITCTANTTAEGILSEINSVLMLAGIHQFADYLKQPLPLETKTDVLLQILRQVKVLIILDNCESILNEKRDIVKPEVRTLLNHLLNGLSSHSKMIITSREEFDPLEGRLQDQVIKISLPELNFFTASQLMNRYPQLEELSTKDKLKIFQKIGGHPYAYEIFCKQLSHFSMKEIIAGLTPVGEELKAFAMLEAAYNRLSPKTQTLLQRLSVFKDDFPIEAARWMADKRNVSQELEETIGWGLMSRTHTEEGHRYSLYSLVRETCQNKLQHNQELNRRELLIKAGEYYQDLVKTSQSLWDLLLARDYFFRAGEFERAAKIVGTATKYLLQWGHLDQLMKLLQESAETTTGRTKAIALGNLATIYQNMGNYQTAVEKYEEVKKIFEELGDRNNVATVLHQLGMVHQKQGDYGQAVEKYQASLVITQELGDRAGIAQTLHQLGIVHQRQGDYGQAVEKYQDSLGINQELGNRAGIAQTLHQLGMVHKEQGDLEAALDKLTRARDTFQQIGDKPNLAKSEKNIARVRSKIK